MKKLSSLIIALFVLGLGTAFGQATATVDVNANVEGSLSVTQQANVEFGTIQAGLTHTIDNNTNSTNLGRVFLEGASESQVFLNLDSQTTLTGPAGSNDIVASLTFFGNEANDGAGSTEITTGDVTLSTAGEYYVFVGSEVTLPNTQANGVYSGSTTIEVSYSSF